MVSRAFNLWKNLILSCIWMDYPLKPSKSSVIGDILVDGHQKLKIGAWIKCSICAELIDKHVHLTDWNHIHGNNEPALSKLRCHWEHSIEKVIPHDGLDHIVTQSWSTSPENWFIIGDIITSTRLHNMRENKYYANRNQHQHQHQKHQ